MATAPAIPSAHAAGGKSNNKKNADRIREGAGRLSQARMGQVSTAAIHVGEIAGSALIGSAVAGYREATAGADGMKIAGKVDARIVAGLAGLIAGLWKAGATNTHLLNVGTGLLTSWGTDYAREQGSKMAAKMATASAPAPTQQAAAPAVPGIVVGRVHTHGKHAGEGEPSHRQERRQGRIHEKIQRLTGRRAELADDAPQAHIPLSWIRPEYRDEARSFMRG